MLLYNIVIHVSESREKNSDNTKSGRNSGWSCKLQSVIGIQYANSNDLLLDVQNRKLNFSNDIICLMSSTVPFIWSFGEVFHKEVYLPILCNLSSLLSTFDDIRVL